MSIYSLTKWLILHINDLQNILFYKQMHRWWQKQKKKKKKPWLFTSFIHYSPNDCHSSVTLHLQLKPSVLGSIPGACHASFSLFLNSPQNFLLLYLKYTVIKCEWQYCIHCFSLCFLFRCFLFFFPCSGGSMLPVSAGVVLHKHIKVSCCSVCWIY